MIMVLMEIIARTTRTINVIIVASQLTWPAAIQIDGNQLTNRLPGWAVDVALPTPRIDPGAGPNGADAAGVNLNMTLVVRSTHVSFMRIGFHIAISAPLGLSFLNAPLAGTLA